MDIRLEKTCEACPEQYDAWHGDNLVGYIRLRWSHFSVTCPSTVGKVVYEATIGPSGWDGCFEDEKQRAYHLDKAKAAIQEWLETDEGQYYA